MEKVFEVLNDKLVEYESRNEYLRKEVLRLEDENKKVSMEYEMLKADNEGFMRDNASLTDEIKRQNNVISALKNKIKELEGDSDNGN